jgi:LCP family protein required for cell wall assembly
MVLALSVVVVLATLGLAGGLTYLGQKASEADVVDFADVASAGGEPVLTPSPESDEPVNYLLVGTDSALGLDEDDPINNDRENTGSLADTIMIVRLDPVTQEARLLSIPRDLWVDVSGSSYRQKINASLGISEAALIETIEDELGIPINHYVQVDFAGFKELVDILDGVPMWFATPARDTKTGLSVETAGCVTLGPDEALAYARSRSYQAQIDGRWRTQDDLPDIGRIGRQQDFIRRSIDRAIDRGFRNIIDLNQILNTGINAVTIDAELDIEDDILPLARAFQSFEADDLVTYQLPVYPDRAGRADIVRLVDSEAEAVLRLFRPQADTGDLDPSRIRVRALNGTGGYGDASAVADGLAAAGFDMVGRDNADDFGNEEVVIRYRSGAEAQAVFVSQYFDPPPRRELAADLSGADVEVVTGETFDEVLTSPREMEADEEAVMEASAETTVRTTASTPSTTEDEGETDETDDGGADDATGDTEASGDTGEADVDEDEDERPTGSSCP